MDQKNINILIIDSYLMSRQAFASIINSQPDMKVKGMAGNTQEALILYRQIGPDVVISDLQLSDNSGIYTITQLRAEDRKARIIALAGNGSEREMYTAITAGVQAYIQKKMHIESLLEAIRLVHSGFRRFPVRPSGYTLPSTSHRLTSRELDVLKLIVEGKRNKEIATKLGIKEKTVKSYISNVFDKMEVNHRTEAATAAIQRGLVHVF